MCRTALMIVAIASVAAAATPSLANDRNDVADVAEQLSDSLSRGVTYLKQSTQGWITEHGCTSCHQVPSGLWAMHRARASGIAVDDAWLTETTGWAVRYAAGIDQTELTERSDTYARLILGRAPDVNAATDDELESIYQMLADHTVDAQNGDGSWNPRGQLPDQRRPLSETRTIATRWCAIALESMADTEGRRADSIAQARRWLADADAGATTEAFVTDVLYQLSFGDEPSMRIATRELMLKRNSDGGWGWRQGERSDALATGQAVFALRRAGMAPDDPAVMRAVRLLLETQGDDGSWIVPSTIEQFNGGPNFTSNDWGTAWAVISLAEVKDALDRYALNESASRNLTPRAEEADWSPVATFSILGYDPNTGEVGGAVQSRVFSVGNGVLWAEANVGAVATQAYIDVSYGPQALELLRKGLTPEAVIEKVLGDDPDPRPERWPKAARQFAVMNTQGDFAAHTGERATDWAGHASGKYCTAQGNILASEAVVNEMVRAFEETEGHLSQRLVAALEAGQEAGGDKRGMQSAAILIVKEDGGIWLNNDIVMRLHVDDHDQPIAELRRLVDKAVRYYRLSR